MCNFAISVRIALEFAESLSFDQDLLTVVCDAIREARCSCDGDNTDEFLIGLKDLFEIMAQASFDACLSIGQVRPSEPQHTKGTIDCARSDDNKPNKHLREEQEQVKQEELCDGLLRKYGHLREQLTDWTGRVRELREHVFEATEKFRTQPDSDASLRDAASILHEVDELCRRLDSISTATAAESPETVCVSSGGGPAPNTVLYSNSSSNYYDSAAGGGGGGGGPAASDRRDVGVSLPGATSTNSPVLSNSTTAGRSLCADETYRRNVSQATSTQAFTSLLDPPATEVDPTHKTSFKFRQMLFAPNPRNRRLSNVAYTTAPNSKAAALASFNDTAVDVVGRTIPAEYVDDQQRGRHHWSVSSSDAKATTRVRHYAEANDRAGKRRQCCEVVRALARCAWHSRLTRLVMILIAIEIWLRQRDFTQRLHSPNVGQAMFVVACVIVGIMW